MKWNEDEFEAFLREFAPREPGPLPVSAPANPWRRLAAAAVVVLAAGTSLWLGTRPGRETKFPPAEHAAVPRPEARPSPQSLSAIALTQLAQNDPQKLDATLDEDSRRILPGFQEKGSTLAALAKE